MLLIPSITVRRAATRLVGLLLFAVPAVMHAQPSLIVLVRHAEKAAVPGNDPPLSELGQARAMDLAAAMKSAPPNAIVVSALQRTGLTAAVVAKETGITPQAIPIASGTAQHVEAVAKAVRAATGIVLVVGHSNTVPAIIKALGGPSLPEICDATYSHFFALTPHKSGDGAALLISRFGANEPAPPSSCDGMTPR